MKIDPKNLNVRSLPSVPLFDKKMLPKILRNIERAIDIDFEVKFD